MNIIFDREGRKDEKNEHETTTMMMMIMTTMKPEYSNFISHILSCSELYGQWEEKNCWTFYSTHSAVQSSGATEQTNSFRLNATSLSEFRTFLSHSKVLCLFLFYFHIRLSLMILVGLFCAVFQEPWTVITSQLSRNFFTHSWCSLDTDEETWKSLATQKRNKTLISTHSCHFLCVCMAQHISPRWKLWKFSRVTRRISKEFLLLMSHRIAIKLKFAVVRDRTKCVVTRCARLLPRWRGGSSRRGRRRWKVFRADAKSWWCRSEKGDGGRMRRKKGRSKEHQAHKGKGKWDQNY